MKIYIDLDFRCYVSNDGTRREVETNYFDGKCPEYIEGYRYVPSGEIWTDENGVTFTGEMVAPAVDSRVLDELQREYEHQQYLDAMAALEAIYGGVTDD